MEINESLLKELLSSLEGYSPIANQFAGKLAVALRLVSLAIVGVLFYIELMNMQKKLASEQASLTQDILIVSAWKYAVAFIMIMVSDQIIDAFLWFVNSAGTIINNTELKTEAVTSSGVPILQGDLGWIEKGIISMIQMISHFAMWIGEIIAKILIFIRFMTLYLYKALSPLLMATMVSDEWSSMGKGFIKQFLALAFQGLLLLLIFKIYPVLSLDNVINITASGDDFVANLGNQFLFLVKSVSFIMVVLGSQQLAQRMVSR